MRAVLLAASAAIASFLVGLWVGSRVSFAPVAAPAVGDAPQVTIAHQADPAVIRALDELRSEIRVLRGRFDSRAEPSHQRAPATASTDEASELVARLRDLVEDVTAIPLHAMQATARLPSMRSLANASGFATREALFHDLDDVLSARVVNGDEAAQAAWKATFDTNSKRWEAAHRIWTLDEIAAQYGRPDDIRADGEGPSYVYINAVRDGLTGSFVFQSRKGYIYDVDVHVESKSR
jgi:hypothetical protein